MELFKEIEIIDIKENEYHFYNVQYLYNKDNKFEFEDQQRVMHYFNPDHVIKYSIKRYKEEAKKKDFIISHINEEESEEDKQDFDNFIQDYFNRKD